MSRHDDCDRRPDLHESFGPHHVVRDVAIQVEEGHICGFLVSNGSGKTTTLRLQCGLLTPDARAGTCLGLDILKQTDAINRNTGYMTQRFSLYDDLTVEKNLDFIARMYGLDKRREPLLQSLHRLGLTHRRDQRAGTLSGGWKQRLSPAACMLHQPRPLLLDEPTAGVDPKARAGSSGRQSIGWPAKASRCWSPPITRIRRNAATTSRISSAVG